MSPLYQLLSSALSQTLVGTLGTIKVLLPSYQVNKCIISTIYWKCWSYNISKKMIIIIQNSDEYLQYIHTERILPFYKLISPLKFTQSPPFQKACQWLAAGQWFSPVSSSNRSYDITEILLKVALKTITSYPFPKNGLITRIMDLHYWCWVSHWLLSLNQTCFCVTVH